MNRKIETEAKVEKEILFQKLGTTWYIFTEVDNDMIYSALPEGMDPYTTRLEFYEIIEDHMIKVASQAKSLPGASAY